MYYYLKAAAIVVAYLALWQSASLYITSHMKIESYESFFGLWVFVSYETFLCSLLLGAIFGFTAFLAERLKIRSERRYDDRRRSR